MGRVGASAICHARRSVTIGIDYLSVTSLRYSDNEVKHFQRYHWC